MKEEESLLEKSRKYAKGAGFRLNPGKGIVSTVIKGLAKNKEKYDQYYCPCRAVTGNKEEDKKIICPCSFHLEEIRKDGKCRCRLFVKG